MADWESIFSSWTERASDKEEAQCENAERAIRTAIQNSEELKSYDISVFAQGSWAANTNVRRDSDVDVCIRLGSALFVGLPTGKTFSDYNYSNSPISYSWFKDAVGRALDSRFGAAAVIRGNKAFDIQDNTYRVHADAVPTLLYRSHKDANGNPAATIDGVAFDSDSNERVINFPEQALANGRTKNTETARCYKRAVRILKRARNRLRENGVATAEHCPSFQIESLLYNVPDAAFLHPTWYETMKAVIQSAFQVANDPTTSPTEVNGIKPLFGTHSSWTRRNACDFLQAVWNDVAFK